MSLILLGADASGESLWFRRDDHEADITMPELAILRMRIVREDRPIVPFQGFWLDESEVTTLIAAWGQHASGERVQPLWPVQVCRHCGTEAVTLIEGLPHCCDRANGYARREDERAS